MTTQRECASCEFFNDGYCRRYPPRYSPDRHSHWPDVEPTDWCGEFRLADELVQGHLA